MFLCVAQDLSMFVYHGHGLSLSSSLCQLTWNRFLFCYCFQSPSFPIQSLEA